MLPQSTVATALVFNWECYKYSHPHHAEPDERIIEYLVIIVYTMQNAGNFLPKKQKSYYFWKKYLSLTLNID